MTSPVREYKTIVDDSGNPQYVNRLFRATPTTGLVRIEWVAATYGQIIPANWSQVIMNQFMNAYIPLRYQVDDAQNLIVKEFIRNGDHRSLIDYQAQGKAYKLAIPTPEHYLPLLYALGLKGSKDEINLFNDKAVGGSLTMTSVRIG